MSAEDRIDPSTRLRLLFVDADQRVLNSMRALFRQDHEVLSASHVHEALAALDEAPVDVVIADDRLPDTNGLDLLHWVRTRAPKAARILLVGAGQPAYDGATIRRAQLFRVLTKPCAPDQLRAAIAQAGRTARVGQASALMRAAASAAQPDGAANDTPAEDHPQHSTPVLSLSDEDSGLHRTLDGAEHTFGGNSRSDDNTPAPTLPVIDPAAAVASNEDTPDAPPAEAGAEEVRDAEEDGEEPNEENSRPLTTRTWSAHGITVEEDAYDDPTDTARVFASMLEDKSKIPELSGRQAVEVSASAASDSTSGVLPRTPLAEAPAHRSEGTASAGAGDLAAARPASAPAAAPTLPATVLVLSDDAITCAEIRRSLRLVPTVVEAATPECALNAVCNSCCTVALLDGRGRSALAIERTARTLASAAPELSVLVFAEIVETPALSHLSARMPSIVSLLYALPTQTQLTGAIAWAHAVACEAPTLPVTPVLNGLDATDAAATVLAAQSLASNGAGSNLPPGLGDRLRRVGRFLTGTPGDRQP